MDRERERIWRIWGRDDIERERERMCRKRERQSER